MNAASARCLHFSILAAFFLPLGGYLHGSTPNVTIYERVESLTRWQQLDLKSKVACLHVARHEITDFRVAMGIAKVAYEDRDEAVQIVAVETMFRLLEKDELLLDDAILETFNSPSPHVRRIAVKSSSSLLGNISIKSALLRCLKDETNFVRSLAYQILASEPEHSLEMKVALAEFISAEKDPLVIQSINRRR